MFKSIIKKFTDGSKDPKEIFESCLRDLNETIPKMNSEISILKQRALIEKKNLAEKESEYTKLLVKRESNADQSAEKRSVLEKKIRNYEKDISNQKESSRNATAGYGRALDNRNEFLGIIHERMEKANEQISEKENAYWQAQRESVLKRIEQVSETASDSVSISDDNPLTEIENLIYRVNEPIKSSINDIIEYSKKILKDIEDHPHHENRCRMFLNYYLDSTRNIINGYLDIKDMSVESESIDNSLQRTEKLLISVKNAFKSLIIKLAEDEVMNLETELTVLEKTLRYEGL